MGWVDGVEFDGVGFPVGEDADKAALFDVLASFALREESDAGSGNGELLVDEGVRDGDSGFDSYFLNFGSATETPNTGLSGFSVGTAICEDAAFAAEIGGSGGEWAVGEVLRAGVGSETNAHERFDEHAGVFEGAGANDNVEIFFACGGVRAKEMHANAKFGVEREEIAEDGAENHAGEHDGSTYAEASARFGVEGSNEEIGLFGFFDDSLATLQVEFAGFGESDATGGPFDQTNA